MIANVERICKHLLPNGRVAQNGKNYEAHNIRDRASSAASAKNYSLLVQISGEETGRFVDMADPAVKGDLPDLWMAVRGINDFKVAKAEIISFLGLPSIERFTRAKAAPVISKTLSASQAPAKPTNDLSKYSKPLKKSGNVAKWLRDVRGLDQDTLDTYRLQEWHGKPKGEDAKRECVVFPFYRDHDKPHERFKKRCIREKKYQRVWPNKENGGRPLLFGWQAALPALIAHSDGPKCLYICEGELDAMALHTARGISAVSVPFGSGGGQKADWIEENFELLEMYDRVYLFFDSDDAGQKGKMEIVKRIGHHRAHWIKWPEEGMDPNAALIAGWTAEQWADLIENAEQFDPDSLSVPSDFADEVWEVHNPTGGEPGVDTPYGKKMTWRARPCEWTVHQGLDGGGKTTGILGLMTHWASQGQRSLIMSFEMPPADIFATIQRQATGRHRPASREAHAAELQWLDKHFLLFNHVGTAKTDDIFALSEYCVKKYGIDHVLIDSLMCIEDVTEDDWEAQKRFVNKVDAFTQANGIHAHLVAHSKKPNSRNNPRKNWPTKHDVKGSGAITARAWNVLCWWRNIDKVMSIDELGEQYDSATTQQARDEVLVMINHARREMFDEVVDVQKQRKNGRLGPVRLYYDADSLQFLDGKNATSTDYISSTEKVKPF